jgi:endonuclease/exonuclease/phosphatase family metal-dependent hydrolase
MKGYFVPMGYDLPTEQKGLTGIAVFSKYPMTEIHKSYYVGSEERVVVVDKSSPAALPESVQNAVLLCVIQIGDMRYRVATTHGPWTQNGDTTDYQLTDFDAMISILEKSGQFILTGDFNAPRGKEAFAKLAERYTDNIPAHYMTSLDQDLHRVKGLQWMVDGLFTTPSYTAKNVRLISGVSDHMAIVADVE